MRRTLPILAVSLAVSAGAIAAHGQGPVGELYSSDASVQGSVQFARGGTQVMSGSQVSAGARPAVLKLARGGGVRICPNTILSVSSSLSGRSLLYSVNKGEVEFHFDLSSEADALQTPDYRVQFIGPGHFDLAMCADDRGELRLRGKNSSAAVIISEMLGDGVYQAPAGSALDFHGGSVRDVTQANGLLCGCAEPPPVPAEKPVTEVAKQEPPPPPPVQPLPPETHVQIDAPFIFHGDEPNDDMVYTLAKIKTDEKLMVKLAPTVLPPSKKATKVYVPEPSAVATDTPKKEGRGFFRRIGSFFGRIFGG